MIDFDVDSTCCFSGHRILEKSFNEDNLEEVIKKVIEKGYKTFLIGMAWGFDFKCFEILLKYKFYNIDIIACVPCKEQSKYYKKNQKEEYEELLKKADKVVCLYDEYKEGCMQERNRFMVDNSSLLITYIKYLKGGTYYTVNYAKKKEKEIIYI